MGLETHEELRIRYFKEIHTATPSDAIDLDTLLEIMYHLDQQKFPGTRERKSRKLALITAYGIRTAFEGTGEKDKYMRTIEIKKEARRVPITYITANGIKAIADAHFIDRFYDTFKLSEEIRHEANIPETLFISLSRVLADSLNS